MALHKKIRLRDVRNNSKNETARPVKLTKNLRDPYFFGDHSSSHVLINNPPGCFTSHILYVEPLSEGFIIPLYFFLLFN